VRAEHAHEQQLPRLDDLHVLDLDARVALRRAPRASEYEAKSCIPSNTRVVAVSAATSSGSLIHHTNGLPKAVRRRAIW
jgi:hypothetical protein